MSLKVIDGHGSNIARVSGLSIQLPESLPYDKLIIKPMGMMLGIVLKQMRLVILYKFW